MLPIEYWIFAILVFLLGTTICDQTRRIPLLVSGIVLVTTATIVIAIGTNDIIIAVVGILIVWLAIDKFKAIRQYQRQVQ